MALSIHILSLNNLHQYLNNYYDFNNQSLPIQTFFRKTSNRRQIHNMVLHCQKYTYYRHIVLNHSSTMEKTQESTAQIYDFLENTTVFDTRI